VSKSIDFDLYAMPPDLCEKCKHRYLCPHSTMGSQYIVYECPEVKKEQADEQGD
jgi:uncharacterized protein (UPF0179 family)